MTLALPAAMLSWASLLAALVVLGAIQHSAWLRAHYSLFLPRPWIFALGAAAVAWAIVRAGSRRPGRLWPRLWALALAMLASLIALAAVVHPGWLAPPQLHALITASLAAVLALAPRLLRIHPDSDWTARVAPLALLLSLGLILPPALIGAQGRVADHPESAGAADGKGVAARIATLRETDAAFRAATDFDWTDFDRRLPQAEAVIGRLRALPREPLAASAGSTAAPPPDAALSAAAQGLMRTVALGLDPRRAGGIPRLSSLGLGAQGLAGPSRVTAGYFAQIGQRFAALDPAGNGVTAGPLADAYAAIADDLRGYLRVIADRWSDAWAINLVPEQLRTGIAATLTPRSLLGKTLFAGQGTGYRATDLQRLWGIDLGHARRLQPGGRNECGGRAFEEPEREYRIDCFAYGVATGTDPAASPDGGGAEVLAEVRIIYSSRGGGLTERSPPTALWYAFAVAPGTTPVARDRFQRATLRALLDALKDSGLTVTRGDADQDFRIKGRAASWKLTGPLIDHHLADRDWVVLRIRAD